MHRAMNETFNNGQVAQFVAHGAIACFGAVVHAARAHRAGTAKTLFDFITLAFMSSFTGAMFALLGLQFIPDQQYLTLALAGTGGYMGVEGMALVIDRIKEFIDKKPQ